MRKLTIAGLVAGLAIVLAACGQSKVSTDTMEDFIKSDFQQTTGQAPKSAECPEDIDAEVGTTTRCKVVDADDNEVELELRIQSVDGDTANFSITPVGGAEPGGEEAETGAELTEENITAFVDALNEDPTLFCDPDNASPEVIELLGGEECQTNMAEEETGEEYELGEITIEGDTASTTVTDEDGTTAVEFISEGGELKVASMTPVEDTEEEGTE
jgi:hypothetical protein